jgi:hypothetical protein
MKPKNYSIENAVLDEAFDAAAAATIRYLNSHPDQWYPCGFSWVKIKPARGRLVEALKEQGLGKTDEFEGGFQVYNPGKNFTQCMDAKYEGSKAFVEVLKKHYPNLTAYPVSRID